MVDHHEIAGDAHLVTVRLAVVELDLGSKPRRPRLGYIDDGRAELLFVREMADVGEGACQRDLARAGEIEPAHPSHSVRERSVFMIDAVHCDCLASRPREQTYCVVPAKAGTQYPTALSVITGS